MNPKLIFYGGVGSTTGANILLQFKDKNVLVDCGLLQSFGEENKNFEKFDYDVAKIDYLLVTHAHIDHIGRIPKLLQEGFKGKIISTEITKEIAQPMLEDAWKVQKTRNPNKLLYQKEDIEKTFLVWQGYKYYEKIQLFEGCFVEMHNAGHILGSAILNVTCEWENEKTKIAFTGDLGNSPSPLLPDTDVPKDVDFMVMESVYGDRNHEHRSERREKLKQAILSGIKKDGTIIIPTFSIERTQVLLYEINNMIEDNEIPGIPVYFDSPLALRVTEIYKKYKNEFKPDIREEINKGDDIFNFPNLHLVKKFEESENIEKNKGAKIILAGSGMSEGGRVVNHEKSFLGDPKATIILVGYQAVGTLGRTIQDGKKEILIFNNGKKEKTKVKATIENITGYSSHKDSEHLLEFVDLVNQNGKLKKVFCIMGEPKSSLFLCQRIREYVGIEAIYPEERRGYELS